MELEPKSPQVDRNQTSSTAALAAIYPNLLNCGSTAIADAIISFRRPAIQEVKVRSGEHSSDKGLLSLENADF